MEQLSIWCMLFAISCGGNQRTEMQFKALENQYLDADIAARQPSRSGPKKMGKDLFENKSAKLRYQYADKPQPLRGD